MSSNPREEHVLAEVPARLVADVNGIGTTYRVVWVDEGPGHSSYVVGVQSGPSGFSELESFESYVAALGYVVEQVREENRLEGFEV
jgi:hypothetical protein